MSEFKNPAGSFYFDSDDFKLEKRKIKSRFHKVLKLAKTFFEIPDLSDKYISTQLKGNQMVLLN